MANEIDPRGIKNVNFTIGREDDEREQEWKKQRLERGFDDTELWSLDTTIMSFIAPRIRAFAKNAEKTGGYPAELGSSEKWVDILNEIADGFEIYPNHFHWDETNSEENWNKVSKAQKLFSKWFNALWN